MLFRSLRVIRELSPSWVIGENVPGILRIAGRTVCEDLEREGYSVTVFNYEAAAVGAPHRRERVFFVGNSEHNGRFAKPELRSHETSSDKWRQEKQTQTGKFARASRPTYVPSLRGSEGGSKRDDVANADSEGLQIRCNPSGNRWATEPNVGRVAHGIPSRVDRLKCLGNAVVPQQAYPIFSVVADIAREAAQ